MSNEANVGQKFDEGKQDWFLLPLELIEPLADVMLIGEKKGYGNFSCLLPYKDANRRFYNSSMRHKKAAQLDPLAINKEYDQQGNYVGECYHLACDAFGSLMRLYHARKQQGLQGELDREDQMNRELAEAASELRIAIVQQMAEQLMEELRES